MNTEEKREKFSVAIVVNLFPPKQIGGSEFATWTIANYLGKRGYDVSVLTSFDEGLEPFSIESGFKIFRLKSVKIRFIEHCFFWLKILYYIEKLRPRIIHIQTISMGLVGIIAKRFFGIPFVIWGRGTDVNSPGWFTRIIAPHVIKNADAVIMLTESMKNNAQNFYPREIFVLPNGIDFERYYNATQKELRNPLRKNPDEIILICVGRFQPEKGQKFLIEAMDIVRKTNTSIRLVLCGSGPEEGKIKNLVKNLNLEDRVFFMGTVPKDTIPEILKSADIFVLPSLSEGFPNVLLEAMASGLPIISTNVDGVNEIVKSGINGYIIPSGSSESIANAIIELCSEPGILKKIGENNIISAKRYRWDQIMDELEKIYHKVTDCRTGPLDEYIQ